MRRKSKATEDIDSQENSSATSEEPQSKSFMVGGGIRTVALNLAGILFVTQMLLSNTKNTIKSSHIVSFAFATSAISLDSITAAFVPMQFVQIAHALTSTRSGLAISV
jgi:hypothetical protein